MFGKTIAEPRLTALYGDKEYKYAGSLRTPLPWTPTLSSIKQQIADSIHATVGSCDFNACLINYYVSFSIRHAMHPQHIIIKSLFFLVHI